MQATSEQVGYLGLEARVHDGLNGATVLIAGGGIAAQKRLINLVEHNPARPVLVLSPTIRQEICELATRYPSVSVAKREWRDEDLLRADIIVAASSSTRKNRKVLTKAAELRRLAFADSVPSHQDEERWKKLARRSIWLFAAMLAGHLLFTLFPLLPEKDKLLELASSQLTAQLLFFVLTGFLAQLVDGMLSMGYGVTSATCLMSFGVSPVTASAAIHTSEIFASGFSGFSHYMFGNVNKKLFKALVIPGVIGAIAGALLLVFLGERAGSLLMPLVATYALLLGVRILLRAFKPVARPEKVRRVGWLAGAGGLLDSFGGGGWGPLVTSSLIAKGRNPRFTIGTVSLTEFFVTLASAATFFVTVGISHLGIVAGMLIGAVVAAPLAARLSGKLPRKALMIAVGVMVIIWCVRLIIRSLA
jgi:hypothetical protein